MDLGGFRGSGQICLMGWVNWPRRTTTATNTTTLLQETFVMLIGRGRSVGQSFPRGQSWIGKIATLIVVEPDAKVGHLRKVDAKIATSIINVLSVQCQLRHFRELRRIVLDQRLPRQRVW